MNREFEVQVLEVTDNDDGSATVTFEMDEGARNLLIEVGFVSLLKKQLEIEEQQAEKETL
jgi:hypothetical protein